ncbi:MAG: biotin--[acetyl-CoA-carboxylase] ligase [Rhodospirillaceae bacterium]|nr:biotin--[acetyl-CoA-carboxylase] ligase [Rhodospirillaceae bacterium]
MANQVKLPPGMTLAAYTSLPSTNDEAKRLAMEEQASDGTIVWSLEQTAGKGRQNRQWLSAPGNIYSSVILRPTVTLENAAQTSFLPALAVAGLLAASISEQNITFKWPNDVLLNGKKICGILLESGSWKTLDQKWLVLGCGINLAHSPAETRIPATSMKEHATIMPSVEEALESYAAHLFNWIQRWQREGFQPIRQAWLERAADLDSVINVDLGESRLTGIFKGLNSHGALELETKNGVHTIGAGDVYFLPVKGLV